VYIAKKILTKKKTTQSSPALVWEQPNHHLDLPAHHQTHQVRRVVSTKELFEKF
jgi:hypothetical protein